ncbi:MAG: glycoside hydrolase family 43 protein, partial [Allosphingosinicella sp.]
MRLPIALTALLAGCAAPLAEGPAPQPGTAAFDWFHYEGADPIDALPAGPGTYRNPILRGFYPDPSITRAGDDYYLVTSTFSYFPGLPVFHSRDLVNWTQIGNAIDRPDQLDFGKLGLSRGVFAPAIEHKDGLFYILNTCVDCRDNFVITATDPAGPWSDPVWLPDLAGGIDPSLFFDEDGSAWLLNNGPPVGEPLYEGHRAIWIQAFDPKALKTFGPRTMLVNGGVDISTKPIWIEGPHIIRKNGWYYLIAAEGGTAEGHSQVVLRSKSVTGPYEPFAGNPILTQRDLPRDRVNPITSAGHADFVQLPSGDWWATFLAVRPYEGDFYNTGRETFLMPVDWSGEWP